MAIVRRSLGAGSRTLRVAVSALGLVVGCASAPPLPPPEPPPETHADASPSQAFAIQSFGQVPSNDILQAALRYPPPTQAAVEAPVSLTASDGTGLSLVSMDARAVVEGPLAFTELRLQFENPEDRTREGRFSIALPPGASVSRLAMRIGDKWQEAEVVERQAARRAYEDFLHRKQDPALLEKDAGNVFRARIFPIPPRGVKDIIVSYSEELTEREGYQLRLRGLPRVGKLRVNVQRDGERHSLSRDGFAPTQDFALAGASPRRGLRNGDVAVLRIKPKVSTTTQTMKSLVVLFDTSASRALGFSQQVSQLGEHVEALRALHGDDVRLQVAAFDQRVTTVFDGALGSFGKSELDRLLAHRPLGASNLGSALAWARQRGAERIVVMTDGIATAGAADGELARAVDGLRGAGTKRLDFVTSGGIRDEAQLRALSRGHLEQDGIVIGGERGSAEVARRLSRTTVSGVTVSVPGASWVWPERLDGLQAGDEAVVYAALGSSAPSSGPLAVNLGGKLSEQISVPTQSADRMLLERAAVGAEVARLSATLGKLTAEDESEKARLKGRIVQLSTEHRVLSDYTALLVLETDDDYRRFGIRRDGLADILTVGKSGIDRLARTAPVVAVTPDPKKDEPSFGKAKKKPASVVTVDEVAITGVDKEASKAMAAPDDPMAGPGDAGLEGKDSFMDSDGVPDAMDAPVMRPPPAPPPPPAQASATAGNVRGGMNRPDVPAPSPEPAPEGEADDEFAQRMKDGPPPLTGRFAEVVGRIGRGDAEGAVVDALAWQRDEPGDVMAVVALGEALEALGQPGLAARAYGSIVDLFPSRADLRRFAASRLERLSEDGLDLAIDSLTRAVAQRPDHLTGHRLLAYALVSDGRHAEAFAVLEAGLSRGYPSGRFRGGVRILGEDLGLVAAAWLAKEPTRRAEIESRLDKLGVPLATEPSLRFVLHWETDANDVDFHIYDGRGGHAFYSQKHLPSGGELYEDVTDGYGPECFTVPGERRAFPYKLQIHYYSRGPMGYGMGKLDVVEHDGRGGLKIERRPFVVMNDQAYVDLGTVGQAALKVAR